MSRVESESEPQLAPLAEWAIPLPPGGTIRIDAFSGHAVTIVGANGAGKSALATWMVARRPAGTVKRLIAHRRIWFSSSGPEISPAQRESQSKNADIWDRQNESRYLDHLDGQRASIALFDLLGMINDQNRQAVELYDDGSSTEVVRSVTGERLLPRLNRILANAGLHVAMSVTPVQTFSARHAGLGVEYPIYQMSDGEKSALLLAAEVLTAARGMTIIVDEPERHLHRSISAGLVEAVIAARPDCAFVVLTHDLDLAATLAARGDVYSLSGCTWKESAVFSWDLREVPRGESLPEVTRRALLGGRREVMFIEGDAASIDLSLYRLLFPEWTCSPVGGCEAVIKSVTGIRASEGFHWVHAVGLVDGDGRSPEERDSLYRRGVLSLPVNEIESLYYLPAVVQSVARAQADLLGESSEALASRGKAAFLKALGEAGTLERLARKMARDEVNRKLADHIPGAIGDENIEISIPSPYPKVLSNLQEMLARRDYEGMVKTVSIRDSAARVLTARAMEFASIVMYERAARARIAEDDDLRAVVRATLGTLPV